MYLLYNYKILHWKYVLLITEVLFEIENVNGRRSVFAINSSCGMLYRTVFRCFRNGFISERNTPRRRYIRIWHKTELMVQSGALFFFSSECHAGEGNFAGCYQRVSHARRYTHARLVEAPLWARHRLHSACLIVPPVFILHTSLSNVVLIGKQQPTRTYVRK